MELNINIQTNKNILTVQDNSTYLKEDDSPDTTMYKKSEVLSLILLESHRSSDEQGTVSKYAFGNSITIDIDGWYTVHYIIIPTKEWFENPNPEMNQSLYGDLIYYTDGEYVYESNGSKIKDLSDLVEIVHYSDNISTNIYCTTQEYVSIANLYQCYIDFCQTLMKNGCFSSCSNKSSKDDETIFKRDLVWMAINVIDYLVDRHSKTNPTLAEVQRIIELIHSCNGICSESVNQMINNYGCGCSKR